ncbi:hypothetical protein [Candidatus Caldatribacterium sp.]|uniref:hypothetical protein n=1 Tax=Candidatus Caldatribacterium sp. TaxID=2282143 RepID=UPI003845DD8F|nr:hypothetical protein [Candidatus Caldatribacterium sp.]
MIESRECPYTETRLAFNTRLTALEKEVAGLCQELSEYRKEWRESLRDITERLEDISATLTTLSTRNSIQDKDIHFIQEELKEKRVLNRWTADKVITILSSIFSPVLVSVLVYYLLKK